MPSAFSTSPPNVSRTSTASRRSNAARASTAASQARANPTRPSSAVNARVGNPSPTPSSELARLAAEKENERRSNVPRQSLSRAGGSRQSAVAAWGREKLPSKDGTAQRNAKEVDGLKNFVSAIPLARGRGWGRVGDATPMPSDRTNV